MTRALVFLLAVVTALLAQVLSASWLYVVAVLLLLGLAVPYARSTWMQLSGQKDAPAADDAADDELSSLGIMDIRPKARHSNGHGHSDEEGDAEQAPAQPSAEEEFVPERDVRPRPRPQMAEVEGLEASVIIPLLQSLRSALQAHAVALLEQQEQKTDYRVIATEGRGGNSAPKRFKTETPLITSEVLTAPVTLHQVDNDALPPHALGYRREATAVRQVLIAPVQGPVDEHVPFLVADTTQEHGFNSRRLQLVLRRYADLVEVLWGDAEELPAPEQPAERPSAEDRREQPSEEEGVRPRRELVREAMSRARAGEMPLALALIYLNRTESLAKSEEDLVGAAERALRARIAASLPEEAEVVRFGECTFGVFYPADAATVETWASDLQDRLKEAEAPIEGGVSIGIAMLDDRHETPDAFRADATEALRTSYESGSCILVE